MSLERSIVRATCGCFTGPHGVPRRTHAFWPLARSGARTLASSTRCTDGAHDDGGRRQAGGRVPVPRVAGDAREPPRQRRAPHTRPGRRRRARLLAQRHGQRTGQPAVGDGRRAAQRPPQPVLRRDVRRTRSTAPTSLGLPPAARCRQRRGARPSWPPCGGSSSTAPTASSCSARGCRPGAIATVAATVPMVVVGRSVRADGVDSVMTDEAVGARLVVDHLAELGHQRIVHIDGGRGAGAAPRRQGYRKAMERAGLGRFIEVLPGDFTERAGTEAAAALVRRRSLPTAVFAANDLVAVGAIETLERNGHEVPGRRVGRRLRQHVLRPPRPRLADHGRPATRGDGPDGAPAARRPDDRAGGGRPSSC